MIFATLPDNFKAINKYPGYFYCLDDDCVYTIKQSGVLKQLKRQIVTEYHRGVLGWKVFIGSPYYTFCKNTKKRNIPLFLIKKMLLDEHTIPVRLE